MENDNPLGNRADVLMSSLDNGPPDQETSRQLREWIAEAKLHIAEGELLRSDLIARIAGMAKAVAVARHSEVRLKEAEDMVTELNCLDASDLLAAYRKTAARFRDTFRSSFDPNRVKTQKLSSRERVTDYK